MIKSTFLYSILLIIILPLNIFAEDISLQPGEKQFIIPRASWGANAQYNSKTDVYWTQILEARASYIAPERSQAAIDYANEKNKKIEEYLYGNFLYQFTSQDTYKTKNEGEYIYSWPLKYTDYVDSIIIHHTHSEYSDSLSGMNNIHKYHSLSNQWGDIGYNYVIGYDGEIYEGREGGDYVVAAHSKYNNFGTVGIALMGNYESEGINEKQYKSLESLVQYLIKHYGIDLNNKRYYHRNCSGVKCDTFFLETYLDSVLIGHRDATHTTCPGEKLYDQIQQLRSDNLNYSAGRTPIFRSNKINQSTEEDFSTSQIQKLLTLLRRFSDDEKQNIIDLIDTKKGETSDQDTIKSLQTIRLAVILSMKE